MRKIFFFLYFGIFIIGVQNASAQKKYPSTFLWKISGNGLTKPSYMYGTMHLQDKELFNLGDSIYAALETVEGFSMEVDPEQLMNALLKSLNEKDDSPLLKDLIEEKKLKKLEKNIENKFGETADKLTVKKIKKYIQNKVYKKKEGQMKTFMDMYLYNIAKKQNKKFAPVEDVEDQLSIIDNYNPKSVEKYLETDSVSEEKYLQDFKKIYINKDLTALAKTVEGGNDAAYANLNLIKRNIKMARRIDSLTKIRTSFIAIGAAHLPGDSGLIKLLRDKGFNIEPVISIKNIKPEEYKYKTVEKDWISSTDENGFVTVQMPIEPSITPTSEDINMKMSMDLTDYSLYGYAAVNGTEELTDVSKISDRMVDYYKKINFEVISNKQITQNGIKGIEFIGKENNEYIYRTRVLFKGKTMAILITGTQNKKYLFDDNFERFFNSLKFNDKVQPKEWIEYVNEKNNFSILLPQKPNSKKDVSNNEATMIFTNTASDANDGSYYMCQTVVPKPGYFMESDSVYFENYKKAMSENPNTEIQYFSPALLNNIPAMHYAVNISSDGVDMVLQGYVFRRLNNFQILVAITTKETADYPNVSSFFNSFKSIAFKKTKWSTQEIKELGITLLAPSTFVQRQTDSIVTATSGKSFLAADENTSTTFYVDVDTVSRYIWHKNDSAYYKSLCDNYKEYTDSVTTFKYDSVNYKADVLLKLNNSSLYKKIHVAINGNKIYFLYAYLPETIMNGDAEQKYFTDYKFTTIQKPTIFENRIKLLTDSLASKDSATALNAFQAYNYIDFTKSDLPYLHTAILKDYSAAGKDDGDYRIKMVADKIKKIADTSTISYINSNYKNTNATDNLKMNMLEILAEMKTEKSYGLLKTLLLNSNLKKCETYSFSYSISDSLLLAKSLFPEVTTLYKDTLLGGAMMQIANRLLDSNMIDKAVALQNQDGILQNATHQIMVFKRDKNASSPHSYDIIQMLGLVNNKQANDLLQKYYTYGDKWDKEPAIVQLLKNDVPVLPVSILKIAEDKENRTFFYDNLKKVGREKYYPKTVFTQKKFAEGYLYELLTLEYDQENPILTFIAEKVSKVNGVEKRFFLFKVKNTYDGEVTYNLGIMGGFDKNIQNVVLKYDDQEFSYDDGQKFIQADVNKQYRKFIEELNGRKKN